MAQRIGKPTRNLNTIKSEKVLPKDTQPSTLVATKPVKDSYCQCICQKCGHNKHEREEKLLKDKLELQGKATEQPSTTHKPQPKTSNIRSAKSPKQVEQVHQTEQKIALTTNPQTNRGCCNCCSTGYCYNYKCCPNTSRYMEAEAIKQRQLESELRSRQAQNRTNYITVEEYDKRCDEPTRTEQERYPIPYYKCTRSWYNCNKEQQFSALNNRVGYGYHTVRKQLYLASDPFDFASEFREDGAHCPSRVPNHRDYQWYNKIMPYRYNCSAGQGCRLYCGVDRTRKCCVQQPNCCPTNKQ